MTGTDPVMLVSYGLWSVRVGPVAKVTAPH